MPAYESWRIITPPRSPSTGGATATTLAIETSRVCETILCALERASYYVDTVTRTVDGAWEVRISSPAGEVVVISIRTDAERTPPQAPPDTTS